MAVTKIIPIHFTIDKSVKYICNPHKTGDCLYVHSEHCVPETAALTFEHHLQEARAGGKIIGRHLIQSFAPGEVDAETAHEIGKKLADEILGGKYAFVMATHIDKGHVHNHFVWGAADIQTHKRYHSNKRSYHEIRAASDRLCEQYDLSIIVPQGVGKHYAEYQAEKQGTSWKAKLKETIDKVLMTSHDYDEFLWKMKVSGVEVKQGAHISFRASGQTRFTRGKTLGIEYTEDSIQRRVSENKRLGKETTSKIQNVIDIENNEKISSSASYQQWAAIFNLKQSAAAYNLVQQYGGMEAFEEIRSQITGNNLSLSHELNGHDATIKNLTKMRDQIRAYGRTKQVYHDFLDIKSQRKKDTFYHEHEADIVTHRSAKKALSKMKQPIPSPRKISNEISRIKEVRAEVYSQYRDSKEKVKEVDTIYKNLYSLMRNDRAHIKSRTDDLSI